MENIKNFLINLYENDSFTTYLIIALIILIIIFIIVFFFGKRDKKIEETKRLNKEEIAKAAFKEEKKELKKLELKARKESAPEPQKDPPDEKPKIEEPILKESSAEAINEKLPNVTIFEPKELENRFVDNDKKEESIEMSNLFSKENELNTNNKDTEEEKAPINMKELNLEKVDKDLEKELNELENIKNEFNEIKLPEISKETKPQEEKHFEPSEVFSSVYVPPKKEKEEDDFDLPMLKSEVKSNESKPTDKSTNIELQGSQSSSFDFSNIKGESYNIDNK